MGEDVGGPADHAERRWPSVLDVVPALLVAALQLAIAVLFSVHGTDGQDLDVVGGTLVVVAGLVLVFRRPWPVPTFYAALAATAGYFALDYEGGPLFWAVLVAFLATVGAGKRVAGIVELVVTYVSMVTLVSLTADSFPWAFAFGLVAWMIVLFAIAEIARIRRFRAADVERWRQEEARRQVSEERLRIARELHDVVAHNISLVNLQASVALHLIDQQPEQARTALATIKDASKEALVELRSVLGVLRQVDEPDDAPRAPTPGLARLDDLIGQAVATGVDARVVTTGPARPLPAGLDLAAFRIVQEALTNAARHAAPTAAEVRIAYGDDLVVEVVDEGRRAGARPLGAEAASDLGSGHGLAGMRERAEAAGGSLEAGPRPGGGWRVCARLAPPAPAPPPSATRPPTSADPCGSRAARPPPPTRRPRAGAAHPPTATRSTCGRRRDDRGAGRRPGADPGRPAGPDRRPGRPGRGGRGVRRGRGGERRRASTCPTWCSWTSACPRSTGSRPPGASRPTSGSTACGW